MRFKVLKVSYTDFPKRLYRVLAIRENTDLLKVAYAIGFSLEMEFEHLFEFAQKNKRIQLNPDHSNNFYTPGLELVDIRSVKIEDMEKEFTFIYDFGDCYEFSCEFLSDVEIELDEDDHLDPLIAKCLEGKGAGIFEDNRYQLDQYLGGDIDPNEICEYDAWNLIIEKYSDFDEELLLDLYDVYESDINLEIFESECGEPRILSNTDDEFYDDDNGEIDDEVLNTFLREEVAFDIFEDIEINKKYRELILKYDINVAYEMIVDCLIEAQHKYAGEEIFSDEVDEMYYKLVDDLD